MKINGPPINSIDDVIDFSKNMDTNIWWVNNEVV